MFINLNAHTSDQMRLILMATDTLQVLGVTVALLVCINYAVCVQGLIFFKDMHRMILNVDLQQLPNFSYEQFIKCPYIISVYL